MTAATGFPTLRLIRIRIGDITLDKLPAGSIMEVENFRLHGIIVKKFHGVELSLNLKIVNERLIPLLEKSSEYQIFFENIS